MENQIFISYRRDGGETLAMLLHDRLKEAGYRVFLDVESLRSGKFNEQLLQVMDSCTDVLLVLPPGGLDRCKDEDDWVRREIAHAIRQKKNIIPIMMRNFTFPKDLPEDLRELPNYNGLSANMSMFPETMQRLMDKFLLSQPAQNQAAAEPKVVGGSIDQTLSNKFQELFKKNDENPQQQDSMPSSPYARLLAQKLQARRIDEYVRNVEKSTLKNEDKQITSKAGNIDKINDLMSDSGESRPDDSWHEFLDEDSDGRTRVTKSKCFSLAEEPGVISVAYVVERKYDFPTLTKYFTVELLESEAATENGETVRQYTVKNLSKDGNPVIHLRFHNADGYVDTNMGFLDRNKMRLSREPMILKYTNDGHSQESNVRSAEIDTERLTDEELRSFRGEEPQVWMDADIDSGNIIIDPENGMPVLRELYYDSITGRWKAKIKLRAGHGYYAMTVRPRRDSSSDEPDNDHISALEAGTFYSTGKHGFPVDAVKAAEYLEQDGSADALYQLALIFFRESEIQDKDVGKQLLEQAADEGSKDAKLQIALDIILDICLRGVSGSQPLLEELLGNSNAGTSAAGEFLRAFALETGILTQDPIVESWVKPEMNAFEIGGYLYAQSAAGYYLPAMLRLKCWDQEEFYYNPLCAYYRQTSDEEHSLAFFALACAVLYGQGFCANTADGLALLEHAAANGSREAAAELEYYHSNYSGRELSHAE